MKTKTLTRIFLLLLVFVAACKSPKEEKPVLLDSYYEYVSGITSGVVSRSEHIVIKFSDNYIDADKTGSEVSSSVLKFSPAISGKAYWIAPDAIEFTPDKLLDWNTKYTGELALGKITQTPEEFSTLIFDFRTPEKQFALTHTGLKPDVSNAGKFQLSGKVKTSDQFDPSEIEKAIKIKCNNSDLNIEWKHNPKMHEHLFAVNNIERTNQKGNLRILTEGKSIGVDTDIREISISVPSISEFKVLDIRVNNTPDQYVEIQFSDSLNSSSDLRGLISLDGESLSRTVVNGNRLKVFPNKRLSGEVKLKVHSSLSNIHNYVLDKDIEYTVNFGVIKPAVQLIGNGVIVPQNKSLIFPFKAVSLKAVDIRITKIFVNNIHQFLQDNSVGGTYRIDRVGRIIHRSKINLEKQGVVDLSNWNSFSVDISKLIDIEDGAIYNVEIGFRKRYSLHFSDENEQDEYIAIEQEALNPYKSYQRVYSNYYYNWREYDNPENHAYYSPNKFVNRNIFSSNHGIIAKTDAVGKVYVYVSDLTTAQPLADVEVSFYDYQNQLLYKEKTNSEGMCAVKTERDPFLIITKKSRSVGYLKIHQSTQLSTSNFDVTGSNVQKNIKGFIYGERDVWRPGDTIFTSFILEDKQNILPKGHPLVFELYNPSGQMVQRIVKLRDNKYIYPFFCKTAHDAPTGNWRAVVKLGAAQFSKPIRVETVKPNRLKVALTFDDDILSAHKKTPVDIQSAWLHGTPARNLKAKVDVTFTPYAPSFKKYSDYDFSTPYSVFGSTDRTLFEKNLDNDGKASFDFSFVPNKEVSGFLRASFITRVFETGGDFSVNHFTKAFSPYKNYVGLNIDWSYKNWNKLDNNREHTIHLATVDKDGLPVNVKGIEVKMYELEYRWWYHSNSENLASYSGKTYHKPVYSATCNTENGEGSFTIDSNENRWGRHLLLVTSPDGHTCGQVIYFGWPWGRGQQKGGAQVLALIAEKDHFKTGEEVTVSFPANAGARALITFETGSEIIGQQWISDLSDFTHFTFEALPEMAPNVFVHVTLLQAHGQTENDLPIRLYGVIPIMVEDENTRLSPQIDAPKQIRPLKQFTVSVSEKNKQAMDYTLAIVDDGLLDLTNFKTPNPWSAFFAREALGIRTYDMYNYVMGALGSRLESMFAVGGGNAGSDDSQKTAERFKPIVQVLGPYRLEAGKKAQHDIVLPQYIGSVRIMVVAADKIKYGNAEKTVPVKQPLMVLATMPRVLSPGDEIDVPLTIFAMDKAINEVNASVETNNLLTVVDQNRQKVFFDEPGEKDIAFKIKTGSSIGIAKLRVEVKSGSESSFYEVEIEVREPNPPTVNSSFKFLKTGQKIDTLIGPLGIDGTNLASIEISSMPPLDLGRRLGYLIRYPHGCIEQITSAAFPQIYLSKLSDLSEAENDKISHNVEACISNLPRYQLASGGFGYWPGSTHESQWGSCYAGYFMIEAEKAGYLVPGNLKDAWLQYTRSEASQYAFNGHRHYQLFTQAYRLYLLALAGEPQIAAMNRLRGITQMNNQTKWLLAGAYALAGMKEAAFELIDMRNTDPDEYYEQTYGSDLRDRSIILQTLLALGEEEEAAMKVKEISQTLSADTWLSTQSIAYALVAVADFVGKTNAGQILDYKASINSENKSKQSNHAIEIIDVSFEGQKSSRVSIENTGQGTLFVNIINKGIKAEVDSVSVSRGIEMTVEYYNRDKQKISPLQVEQGTDIEARIRIKNTTSSGVDNIALSQLIPAGWEIMNERLFAIGATAGKTDSYDYRDIRDDRVYTYFSLDAYESKSFSTMFTAAYAGKYIMPAISCEAMYNYLYYAKQAGCKVEVVKP